LLSIIKDHHRVYLVEQLLQENVKKCESKVELKGSDYGVEEVKSIEYYKYFFNNGNQSDTLTLSLEVKGEKKKKKKKKKKHEVKVSTKCKSDEELPNGSEADELIEAIIRECSLDVNPENGICDIDNIDHSNKDKELLEQNTEQNNTLSNHKSEEVKADDNKVNIVKKDEIEVQNSEEVKKVSNTQPGK